MNSSSPILWKLTASPSSVTKARAAAVSGKSSATIKRSRGSIDLTERGLTMEYPNHVMAIDIAFY
jgi:hypothetical protein